MRVIVTYFSFHFSIFLAGRGAGADGLSMVKFDECLVNHNEYQLVHSMRHKCSE